jgi:hypothetical protein
VNSILPVALTENGPFCRGRKKNHGLEGKGLPLDKLADTLQTLFTTEADQAAKEAGMIQRRRKISDGGFVQTPGQELGGGDRYSRDHCEPRSCGFVSRRRLGFIDLAGGRRAL